MRASIIPAAAALAVFVVGICTPAVAEDVTPTYVGVAKCKMCHKKPEEGDQFGVWSKSAHAKAFETLASEKAKADAAKQGIADPQKDEKCLKCHATAAAVMADLANQKITLEEGVSCESCHGAGSEYYKKATMEGVAAGTIKAETVGLVLPDEATCKNCHTPEGNSFYKEFKFEERVKLIAHPIPKAE